MLTEKPIHPDFLFYLKDKDRALIDLFTDLRNYVWEQFPAANELLYHTHALTSVFTLSEKLSDGFCHIPIYTEHLNLGFNKGSILDDPAQLLAGTGKWIRHIPVRNKIDYQGEEVRALIQAAIALAQEDQAKPSKKQGQVISKIKR
ncbi:MAG: DUF1801 domain-containing protein [Saprospiraceae bacterium]|nr:DUF1801 domain-containing protein [Saprospiraceae bacterium]